MKKINVITLGCSKNTVDSEHLMARLAAAGYEVLFDSDRTDAKVVVINTCGFIGDAKQESIDMILRAAAAKQAGKIERLFVVGCLSERYADELRAEIPEVDDYFGARTWDGIVRALGASEDPALATERRLTTPKHYAYLKISEGCNRKCIRDRNLLRRGIWLGYFDDRMFLQVRKSHRGFHGCFRCVG